MTPFCINENGKEQCGECRTDNDCKSGFTCNTVDPHLQRVQDVTPTARGARSACSTTASGARRPTSARATRATAAPTGRTASRWQCAALTTGAPPECVECTKDADCTEGGVCDVLIGQCVPTLAAHETADCCGSGCLKCPAEDPLCLPGPFGTACAACRNDMECPDGDFCIEGQCSPCTTARHCGPRCETCGGDTPFCLGAQLAKDAACVRCTEDSQCVGGKCDATTHACKPTCPMSCAPDTPYCDGQKCVGCYADTQCPCNGTLRHDHLHLHDLVQGQRRLPRRPALPARRRRVRQAVLLAGPAPRQRRLRQHPRQHLLREHHRHAWHASGEPGARGRRRGDRAARRSSSGARRAGREARP